MGGQDRANPFAAARGDKSALRPVAKLLWTLGMLKSVTDFYVQMLFKIIKCSLRQCSYRPLYDTIRYDVF